MWVTCCQEDKLCSKSPCLACIDDDINIDKFHECFYYTIQVNWRLATKAESMFPKCATCASNKKEAVVDYFNIADQIIHKAYPGKNNMWGEKQIPNYGILRDAIAFALRNNGAIAVEPVSKCYHNWKGFFAIREDGICELCKQKVK
jgi:hypothetical protein